MSPELYKQPQKFPEHSPDLSGRLPTSLDLPSRLEDEGPGFDHRLLSEPCAPNFLLE